MATKMCVMCTYLAIFHETKYYVLSDIRYSQFTKVAFYFCSNKKSQNDSKIYVCQEMWNVRVSVIDKTE